MMSLEYYQLAMGTGRVCVLHGEEERSRSIVVVVPPLLNNRSLSLKTR